MSLSSLSTKCFGKHLLKAQMQNAFRTRELLPDCEPKKFPTTFFLHKTRNLEAHLAWNTSSSANAVRGARCLGNNWNLFQIVQKSPEGSHFVKSRASGERHHDLEWYLVFDCCIIDLSLRTQIQVHPKLRLTFFFKTSKSTFLILTENSSLKCF